MKKIVGFNLPAASPAPAPAAANTPPARDMTASPWAAAAAPGPARTRTSSLRDSLNRPPERIGQTAVRTPSRTPFGVYAHRTGAQNLRAIHEQGLLAGKSQGMGDPQTGLPVPHAVYVATGHGPLADTAECAVGVISSRPPEPDPNYPLDLHSGQNPAGAFHRDALPPLREAGTPAHPTATTPFAFTTPMTPRTAAGAARFIRQTTGQAVSAEHARQIVEAQYKAKFHLDYRASAEPGGPYRQALANPSAPASPSSWQEKLLRSRSDDDLFDMEM